VHICETSLISCGLYLLDSVLSAVSCGLDLLVSVLSVQPYELYMGFFGLFLPSYMYVLDICPTGPYASAVLMSFRLLYSSSMSIVYHSKPSRYLCILSFRLFLIAVHFSMSVSMATAQQIYGSTYTSTKLKMVNYWLYLLMHKKQNFYLNNIYKLYFSKIYF
jgi:hypothetical protein